MHTKGVHIRHAENGGEVRIANFIVDGYDESAKTVYEYHGCFWHKHFCHVGYHPNVWNKTVDRESSIRDLGYNVVSMTIVNGRGCRNQRTNILANKTLYL